MTLEPPKRWNNLPPAHRDVLVVMLEYIEEQRRWPLIPEMATRLQRTKSSIKNSLFWLQDKRIINVTRFGKAMPPSYEISGVQIHYTVNVYGDNYDLGSG